MLAIGSFLLTVEPSDAIFLLQWKFPAYSGAFLLTVEPFYLQLTLLAFLLTIGAFSLTTYLQCSFACSGKVHLISALRDCKQRSLTVSKKASTVSKKLPPLVEGQL